MNKSKNDKPVNINSVEFFDDETAASYVGGIQARAVRGWRMERGLPFMQITKKVIRIRRSDLDKWIDRTRTAIIRKN